MSQPLSRYLHPFDVARHPSLEPEVKRAILASGDRKPRLRGVTAPTLVIHGTVDPLVHPFGGKDTAAAIPGAKLMMVEGMGHALPLEMWPEVIDAITAHAQEATTKAA